MKAYTRKGILYIEANWTSGDIEKVKKISKWLQDHFGYELIDGNDDPKEYYVGLSHNGTAKEAIEDYKVAKAVL